MKVALFSILVAFPMVADISGKSYSVEEGYYHDYGRRERVCWDTYGGHIISGCQCLQAAPIRSEYVPGHLKTMRVVHRLPERRYTSRWSRWARVRRRPRPNPACRFRPDKDRQFYQEFVYPSGWARRPCPYGTLYNESMCLCVDMAPISMALCRPQLYVDFNEEPITDVAGTNIYIGNSDVTVEKTSQAGRFNRRARLNIPMYANAELGDLLTVTFRFYDYQGGDDEQVLVSNCLYSQPGSMEIVMSPKNKEIIFRVDTIQSPPRELRIPYEEQKWKNVTFTFDGNQMKGRVDTEESAVMAKGPLEVRSGDKGLMIGQCPVGRRRYVGYIDDFKLHKCVDQRNGFFPRENTAGGIA